MKRTEPSVRPMQTVCVGSGEDTKLVAVEGMTGTERGRSNLPLCQIRKG